MAADMQGPVALLLVRAGARLCGLLVGSVVETMRPLALEPLQGSVPFILGVALVRSVPVPVLDLALALGATRPAPPSRFVTLRDDRERLTAVAVESVLGVFSFEAGRLQSVPPLITGLTNTAIEAFSRWDGGLLTIVRSARLIPDEVWRQLASQRE